MGLTDYTKMSQDELVSTYRFFEIRYRDSYDTGLDISPYLEGMDSIMMELMERGESYAMGEPVPMSLERAIQVMTVNFPTDKEYCQLKEAMGMSVSLLDKERPRAVKDESCPRCNSSRVILYDKIDQIWTRVELDRCPDCGQVIIHEFVDIRR